MTTALLRSPAVRLLNKVSLSGHISAEALAGPGPVVVCLQVEGRLGQKTPRPPRPMAEQIKRLREALAT